MQYQQMAVQTQTQMAAQIDVIAGFLNNQNQAFAQKEAEIARNMAEMLKLKEQEIASLLAKLQSQQAEMADKKNKKEDKQKELQESETLFLS